MNLEALQATAHKRLNVGCGEYPLRYYTNLDANPALPAEIHATVPPLPYDDNALSEIYAGHVLEHMTQDAGRAFLAECYRTLEPGGRLGVLVPDTFEIMRRYTLGMLDKVEYPEGVYHAITDLDEVCALFLYSTAQDSPHQWSYDAGTLRRAMERAGFRSLRMIDRYADPRIPVGAWYQCGWDGFKLGKTV